LSPLVAALALAGSGEARATNDLRVVLRLASEADHRVLERVRGQASDLPVALMPIETTPLEATLGEQVAVADRLAAGHQADIVIWFAHDPMARIVVHVSQMTTRNVLVRATSAGRADGAAAARGPSLAQSPALEAAGLVVRTALMALVEGGRIGVSRDEISGNGPLNRWRAAHRLAVGFIAVRDGITPRGQQGLAGTFGLQGERLAVEINVSSTLPAPVSDELATVALSRATLSIGGAFRQPLGAHVSVAAGLEVGAAVVFRSTTPRDPRVVATPASRRISPFFSPLVRLSVTPGWMGIAGLGPALGVGADYLPGLPALTYRRDGALEHARRPSRLQPRVMVGLELVRR
jgi:hypothetical protein